MHVFSEAVCTPAPPAVGSSCLVVHSCLLLSPICLLLPPFFRSGVGPADEGPSAGTHGEGGLAGPADLQRDRNDQRGGIV